MSARLRLDLIVRRYPPRNGLVMPGEHVDRWTWRLWSGSRIVATSGPQLYSRRIDCARGAEVGAGLFGVADALQGSRVMDTAHRCDGTVETVDVEVRLIDERTAS